MSFLPQPSLFPGLGTHSKYAGLRSLRLAWGYRLCRFKWRAIGCHGWLVFNGTLNTRVNFMPWQEAQLTERPRAASGHWIFCEVNSSLLKVIRNDNAPLTRACVGHKSLVFHCNYVCISYRFWDTLRLTIRVRSRPRWLAMVLFESLDTIYIARQHTHVRYWYTNSVRLSVTFRYSVETA